MKHRCPDPARNCAEIYATTPCLRDPLPAWQSDSKVLAHTEQIAPWSLPRQPGIKGIPKLGGKTDWTTDPFVHGL